MTLHVDHAVPTLLRRLTKPKARLQRDGASWHNPVACARRDGREILSHQADASVRSDRSLGFFIVIGLPVFILGLVLIVRGI
jgi:hypothetical protein